MAMSSALVTGVNSTPMLDTVSAAVLGPNKRT